jgi:hypothetical protein
MPVFSQKFSATQDAGSETQARALLPTSISDVEQLGVDALFDFILTPRRRGSTPRPQDSSAQGEPDVVATMTPEQDIRASVIDDAHVVVRRPPPANPRERFIVLQRWEGTVSSQDDGTFTAVLRDLTDPTQPDEEVNLPFTEVADDDRMLACPGAVFYWAIGYRVKLAGSRERVSSLRFRRLPEFTRRDLKRIHDEAARLSTLFGSRPAE